MNLLDQLERVTSEEHEALVHGDWRSLEACVQQKTELAGQLSSTGWGRETITQAKRLFEATRYNQQLASSLSCQLSEILSYRQRRSTYDHRGRCAAQAPTMMRFAG